MLLKKSISEIKQRDTFQKSLHIYVHKYSRNSKYQNRACNGGYGSDLVVGLGISTAASECYFAGTLAFHADLTGFINNEFGNRGLGKIVFRDIESLKAAIQEVIDRGAREKYLEYKELYYSLDPFQDGLSYKRVGFILKNLQELLAEGLSRKEAVQVVQERYKDFVHTTTRIKG